MTSTADHRRSLREFKAKDILEAESKRSQMEDINNAKALLREDGKKEEAIEILVAVSKTGNKDATALLAQCLENDEGITDANRDIVEWCVKTSEVDKRLDYAMTELYMSLKQEGKETVTVEDIKDALKTAKQQEKESSASSKPSEKSNQEQIGLMSILTSAMSVGGKDEITLSEFMHTAMGYAKGEVPQMEVVLEKDELEDYNKASRLEKVLKYPHQYFESVKFDVLSTISKRGSSWLKSLIPTSQIQTLALLYFYNHLSSKMLWFIVPLVIFYISMTALVVFSLQMFYGRQSLKKLKNFSSLLRKFNPGITITEMEAKAKFKWNTITPYIWFFVFILITVAVYPLCDKTWIPCSELSLIALFFTVSAFRGLPDEYDDFTMYTIGLKVMTLLLYSFRDVRGLWVLCHPLLSIPLSYKLELQISVPGILHIAILAMLVVMAVRHSWSGIHKILIPHLVCLLWWQLFTELFVNTTWNTLIRASIGWVIFITLLPLVIVYIFVVFLGNFLQWFLVLNLAMKLAVTALCIGASSVLILYSNINIPEDVRKRRKYVLAGVGVVVFFLLGPMLYINYVPSEKGAEKMKLSWDSYDRLCGPEARRWKTEAALQATCGEYIGETVTWSGRVTFVKVASIDNGYRTLVRAMPKTLRPTLKCLLGGEDEQDTSEKPAASGWLFKRRFSEGCSLKSFDRYTFVMGVDFTSKHGTLAATVTVPHKYYQTMMTLTKDTVVTVKGSLNDGLGSPAIKMSLRNLFIDGVPVQRQRTVEKDDILAGLKQAGRYSVHFFFSPLINEQGEYDPDDDDDDDVNQ